MNEQKADDLKAKPSEFYKTFRPFLSDKKQPASEIHIKTNGRIENWGYDSISPRMLRLASSGISDSLKKLFNECIRKGEWPEAWKKGEWNPVHKKDDRLDERNYRPITLLSTVDKVFESMMSIQVNNDFESKLDSCISAYRKKHSCETTLLRLTEDWKLPVDSKQFIGILSTDMSKALDSLHPSLIINQLKA